MGWTQQTAQAIQDDQFGVTARTASTLPLKLAPETVAGTTSAAGTEIASTARGSITMAASTVVNSTSPAVSSNSAAVNIVAGAGATVVAVALWDSSGTPVRKSHGPLGTTRTVAAGDTLAFAIGSVAFQTTDTP